MEYDPFFFTHNRLKGFTRGYRLNHLKHLSQLESNRYDLIWVKASLVADLFIRISRLFFSLDNWLNQLDRIASPSARIVICPFWEARGSHKRVADLRNNRFAETLFGHGYRTLRPIEKHNSERYPITFLKDLAGTTPEDLYQ